MSWPVVYEVSPVERSVWLALRRVMHIQFDKQLRGCRQVELDCHLDMKLLTAPWLASCNYFHNPHSQAAPPSSPANWSCGKINSLKTKGSWPVSLCSVIQMEPNFTSQESVKSIGCVGQIINKKGQSNDLLKTDQKKWDLVPSWLIIHVKGESENDGA